MSNKILLVLWGESYRSGPQMTRTRGTGNYIKSQLFASKSHVDMIDKIKKIYNLDTDVFIDSYKLNDVDDDSLITFYKDKTNVIQHTLHPCLFESEISFLNDMYDRVRLLNIDETYSHILFVRIDIYLKRFFIQNIHFGDKIQFAFIDSNLDIPHTNASKLKNICQQIVIYPNSFFYVIHDKIIYNATHYIMNNLINNKISENSIEYLVNTFHVCSTDLGWNPLFVQVGRKYNLNYRVDERLWQSTVNHVFDNQTKLIVFNPEKSIDYWNKYKETEEAEENDEILRYTD
jgi:hypothetical protein